MYRSKSYRNISAKIRFFGLEVGDWGVLAAVSGASFSVVESLLFNIGLVFGLWLWMRQIKAKKPEGYTTALVTFWGSPRALHVKPEFIDCNDQKRT